MNTTIEQLKVQFGTKPEVSVLLAQGWQDITGEHFIAAKPEYTTGTNRYNLVWPDGFSELLDGRIVYRTYYGGILLAPSEYQPVMIADEATRKTLYRQAMVITSQEITE